MVEDMIQTGLDWLNDQREAYLAGSVVYHRGAYSVTITNATKGKSRREDVSTFGNYIKAENVDWLIAAAEIVINGSQVLPARYDTIVWTDGDDVFNYSDSAQKYLRIFTKQIGSA